jgi:uncharacterized cupin superfamily protein
MPKVDLESVEATNATGYPPPFDEPVQGRWWKRIAPLAGLTELGASHVVLKPGAWSSQRHWHESEDEMVVMIFGEAVLVEDGGETLLRAGDVAAWKAGATDGHHMINRSEDDCVFIAISAGNRAGGGSYSDIDMKFEDAGYFHKDGTPYPAKRLP